ncbi:hypothetical protein Q4578_19800 [Shimia thalassica]|uniref:hypothetical protein n=1 Tax=Shimia thalassica TaxID=1715693 RepID=UPI0026E1695E|nr:hypothetical protein [Shimia thalassica]MDO6523844.1 hypothetical protein [Shimia thalassica]
MLFADRNILSDQTAINDFRLFIGDIAKLSSQAKTIERSDGSTEAVTLAVTKNHLINTAYQVYHRLYQALTGPKESQKFSESCHLISSI